MIINPYIFGGFDPDAQAFITAASITNTTQQNAINTLVVDLKGYGVWTKMKAIYPFIGGTASTHKWNLKDPRDLDAAFRLVFNGGWTHSSTGATPNGTNAFANTYLNPLTVIANNNSNGLSYYSGSNLSETNADPCNIGSVDAGNNGILIAKSNSTFATRINNAVISFANSNMKGFFAGFRQSSILTKIFYNVSVQVSGNSGGTLPNYNMYIGAINTQLSGAYGYVKNDFRFSHIGDGLTDTEAANLYTAVQAYQTSLSRQV
jgi:hypothetical protein